jgi:hypothetical protein
VCAGWMGSHAHLVGCECRVRDDSLELPADLLTDLVLVILHMMVVVVGGGGKMAAWGGWNFF